MITRRTKRLWTAEETETAKLNGIDPQGWLADTLACVPDYKITHIDDLLPWRWRAGIKKDPLPT